MRGGNKVHARADGIDSPCGPALCGANSHFGLRFISRYEIAINCKNCLKLIEEENAKLRTGIT